MPPETINLPNEMETDDLMLQKLNDIQDILTMRLQQANKHGEENRDEAELNQQLLVKILASIDLIKDKEEKPEKDYTEILNKISEQLGGEQEINITLELI